MAINQANSSNPAKILTDNDIDDLSAASDMMLSHKFFVNCDKNFNKEKYDSFLGIGLEVEFDGKDKTKLKSFGCVCNQWMLCIRGGLRF